MSTGVPPDLWDRLARLDVCCHVTVYSARDPDAAGPGPRTFWVANARRRDTPSRFVEVTGATMAEAIVALLAVAERQKLGQP